MSDPQLPPFPNQPGGAVGPAVPNPAGSPDAPPNFNYQVLPDLTPPQTPIVVVSTPYLEYAIVKTVFDWSGLDAQAVQGPPGTPADPIRVSAPWGFMVVRWFARCRAGKPAIPSRDLGDPNCLYYNGWVAGSGPGFFTDGTKCVQVEGLYVWKLLVPYKETDTLVVAAFPFTNESAANNAVTPDMYDADILGPNQPPAGAPTGPVDF